MAKELKITFNDAQEAEFQQILADTGLSRREALNEALTVYNKIIQEKKAGKETAIVDQTTNSYREIITPGLQNVKPSQP